jgi:hypothetical protein
MDDSGGNRLKKKERKEKKKRKNSLVKTNRPKEVTTMTFINPTELGLYAPKTNERVALAAEAQKCITQAIYTYKQLFYGLRSIAWSARDKRATFYDALTNGELDQFKIAPGHRASDGSYTKDEWDYDRLNAYMWNRFRERFDAAFDLDTIAELKTLKDIKQATDELLEFALTNWGEAILGDNHHLEKPRVEPIGKGVTRCKLEYEGILLAGSFQAEERILTLSAKNLPEVIIRHVRGADSWKGNIHFDPFGQIVEMNSRKAEVFSRILALAARLNLGINEFMADPEGFLGIESAKTHQRALQRIKQRLLEINQDNYERRKAEADDPIATRRVNEVIDTAEDELAGAETGNERRKSSRTRGKSSKRKLDREREAEEWLENNPEFSEDIDALMGIASIDS